MEAQRKIHRRAPLWSTKSPFGVGWVLTIAAGWCVATSRPAVAAAADEQLGAGPQILTADLLRRQEVRADTFVVNWAIVGASPIQSVTVNGEPETFTPGDTIAVRKEITLKLAQTVVTVVAVDAQGAKRELSYLIVNPELPLREPEVVVAPPTKIPETKEEQKKREPDFQKAEAAMKAQFKEVEFTPWNYDGPYNNLYNREVRRGMYPVWIEARFAGQRLQYRMVLRPIPKDVLTHRKYENQAPADYNDLLDDMAARGYQQLFREVLIADSEQWRIQSVWVLKGKRQ